MNKYKYIAQGFFPSFKKDITINKFYDLVSPHFFF